MKGRFLPQMCPSCNKNSSSILQFEMFVINVMSQFLVAKIVLCITGLRFGVFFQTWHLRRARSFGGGEKKQ